MQNANRCRACSVYDCNRTYKPFPRLDEFYEHVRTCHKRPERFLCILESCRQGPLTRVELVEHLNTQHSLGTSKQPYLDESLNTLGLRENFGNGEPIFLDNFRSGRSRLRSGLNSSFDSSWIGSFDPDISTQNQLLSPYAMNNYFGFGSFPGMESLHDFYSNSQSYQDDLLDLDSSFEDSCQYNLAPELRALNQPQAPLSWQVQQQFQQKDRAHSPMQRFTQESAGSFFAPAPLAIQPPGFFGLTSPGGYSHHSPSTFQNSMGSLSMKLDEQSQSYDRDAVDSYVQLSQIQGFSDMSLGEAAYDSDEGYGELSMKTECAANIDDCTFETEYDHHSRCHSNVNPREKDSSKAKNLEMGQECGRNAKTRKEHCKLGAKTTISWLGLIPLYQLRETHPKANYLDCPAGVKVSLNRKRNWNSCAQLSHQR